VFRENPLVPVHQLLLYYSRCLVVPGFQKNLLLQLRQGFQKNLVVQSLQSTSMYLESLASQLAQSIRFLRNPQLLL
jgi:hypothetical protein